jgi:transcriptional regulator with XRE-family HTH domain
MANTLFGYHRAVKLEVRATGLKAMREKRGLTQRQLARDLGVSQNYIPAIEAGSRKAGRDLMASMVKYFGCEFWDLFEVVLVDPETGREQTLVPGKPVPIRQASLA